MSGKGKGKAVQKDTKTLSSSASSSSSSSFSSSTKPQVHQPSHFDAHFPGVEFIAKQIEPHVNMKVYAHGSWTAIELLMQNGFLNEVQQQYFQNHLEAKADVDVIVLFDDDALDKACDKKALRENEEKIYQILSKADPEKCSIVKKDYELMVEASKFFKFEYKYGGMTYDLEIACKESSDHSLSPASLMLNVQRENIFGKNHDHSARHKRFLAFQEISMPGLNDLKLDKDISDYEIARRISFVMRHALFYVNAGFILDAETIKKLKKMKENRYLWESVQVIYDKKYFKTGRASDSLEDALKKFDAMNETKDKTFASRLEDLYTIWHQYVLNIRCVLALETEINDLNRKMNMSVADSRTIPDKIIKAIEPLDRYSSVRSQIQEVFDKLIMIREASEESLANKIILAKKRSETKQRYTEFLIAEQKKVQEMTVVTKSSETASHSLTNSPAPSVVSSASASGAKKSKKKSINQLEKDSKQKQEKFDEELKEAQKEYQKSKELDENREKVIWSNARRIILSGNVDLAKNSDTSEKLLQAISKSGKHKNQDQLIRNTLKNKKNDIAFYSILMREIEKCKCRMTQESSSEISEDLYFSIMHELTEHVGSSIKNSSDSKKQMDNKIIKEKYNEGRGFGLKKKELLSNLFMDLQEFQRMNDSDPVDNPIDDIIKKIIDILLKKKGEMPFYVHSNLFLDPLMYYPNPKDAQKEQKDANELLRAFIQKMNDKDDRALDVQFYEFSKDKLNSEIQKTRAFMLLLAFLNDHELAESSKISELYTDYIFRVGVLNIDCLKQRNTQIQSAKNLIKRAINGSEDKNRADIIRERFLQAIDEKTLDENGNPLKLNADVLFSAVIEDDTFAIDSYETLEQIFPEFLRTSFQDEPLKDIHERLTKYLFDKKFLDKSRSIFVNKKIIDSFMKGVLLAYERVLLAQDTPKAKLYAMAEFKYFYEIARKLDRHYYQIYAEIYRNSISKNPPLLMLNKPEIMSRSIPSDVLKGIYELKDNISVNYYIDVIFRYTAIQMIRESNVDFIFIITSCSEHLRKTIRNNKNHSDGANEVMRTFSQSYMRLSKIYSSMNIGVISKMIMPLSDLLDDGDRESRYNKFLIGLSIGLSYIDRRKDQSSISLDMLDMFRGFALNDSQLKYQTMQMALSINRPVSICESSVEMILDIFSSYLSCHDKMWSPVSSANQQINCTLSNVIEKKNRDDIYQMFVSPGSWRYHMIKVTLRNIHEKKTTEFDDVFDPNIIKKLAEIEPDRFHDDIQKISELLKHSSKVLMPAGSNADQLLWQSDYVKAVYMLKIDEYVIMPDATAEQRVLKSNSLAVINKLSLYFHELKFIADRFSVKPCAAASSAPMLITAPVSLRPPTCSASSVSKQANGVSKI